VLICCALFYSSLYAQNLNPPGTWPITSDYGPRDAAGASKYPFRFQPREQQKLYGKRFILCMLADESKRDEYIELMKSYIGNVILKGIGIKDSDGRFTKIKTSSIEKDEDPELNFG